MNYQKVLICTENCTCLDCIIAQQVLNDLNENIDEVEQSENVYLLDQAQVVFEGLETHNRCTN